MKIQQCRDKDKQKIQDLKKELSELDRKINNLMKQRDSIDEQLKTAQNKTRSFLRRRVVTDRLTEDCRKNVTDILHNTIRRKYKRHITWESFFRNYPCASKLQEIEDMTDETIDLLLSYWNENGILIEDDRNQDEKPFLMQSPRKHILPLGNSIYQQMTKHEQLFTMHEVINTFPTQTHILQIPMIGPKKLEQILNIFRSHGIEIPAK